MNALWTIRRKRQPTVTPLTISTRQFQRSFILAEGIDVVGASLESGLLHVDLLRPKVETRQRIVKISSKAGTSRNSEKKKIDVAAD